jgi:hypothetical protein
VSSSFFHPFNPLTLDKRKKKKKKDREESQGLDYVRLILLIGGIEFLRGSLSFIVRIFNFLLFLLFT